MRLFLNSGLYPRYRQVFDKRYATADSFKSRRNAYLYDRFNAPHILKPVLDGDESAFFTNGDDEILQKYWARDNGVRWTGDLSAVLLAQIEEHGTEVFYNLDPMRFGSRFVRRLPGCVKHTLCWRAAPSPGGDFSAYDLVVCNFPTIIASWRSMGWHAEYFFPAHDPVMDQYAAIDERLIDVCFVGGFSRHHRGRSDVLESVAGLSDRYDIRYHLDRSRYTRLAEHPFARLLPIGRHRRPTAIRSVSREPVFGRDLYEVIGSSKIVLNGAIDMAGNERGNMRCFEAMGCGALLVSDAGSYPDGMLTGDNMLAYSSATQAIELIERVLDNWDRYSGIARKAYQMVSSRYSKERQWDRFGKLLDAG